MDRKPTESAALKVLLQENEHVQSAISRATSTIHTLFGVVLPAVFGVVLFSASSEAKHLPLDVAGFALAGAVSVAWIYSCGLWIEVFKYIRYKYLQLQPRLYALAGLESDPNFVQYLASTTEPLSFLPSMLFQLGTFILGTSLSLIAISSVDKERTTALLFGALAFLALGFITALGAWGYGLKITRQIAASAPAGSAGEH